MVSNSLVHFCRYHGVFVFLKKAAIDFFVLALCAGAYGMIQLLKSNSDNLFLHGYADDLISLPALLSYVNLVLSAFGKRRITGLLQCVLFSFLCGLIWEFAAIPLKPNSVCDILDLVCYTVGAIIFYLFNKAYGRFCYGYTFERRKRGKKEN